MNMHRWSSFVCLFFLLSLMLLVVPFPAKAAISPTLSVSPAKVDITILPEQTTQVVIKLMNKSSVALPFRAVTMDWAPKDNLGNIEFGQSLPNHSAKDWFQITPDALLLQPDETKEITVTINPPENLTSGSYFATTMFQAELPTNYFDETEETQARIIPWIGTLFLLKFGDIPQLDDSSLTISQFQIPRVNTSGKIPVKIEVTNNTAFHLAPQTEFSLLSLRGPIKAKITTQERTIMPGRSRVFDGEISEAPLLGIYRGQAEIRIASYFKRAESPLLYRLTWQGGIILSLIIAMFIIDYRNRKRLLRVLRVLFSRGPKPGSSA